LNLASRTRKPVKLLAFSFSSLLRHKLRSFLSVLGIVFGTMAVLSMISIGEGTKKQIIDQIESLGVRNIFIRHLPHPDNQKQNANGNHSKGLTSKDIERLKHGYKLIEEAAALREISGTVFGFPANRSPPVLAVSSNYFRIMGISLEKGRFITAQDREQKNNVCVMGADTAKKLRENGSLRKTIRIENKIYTIIGILRPSHMTGKENESISIRNHNQSIFIPFDRIANEEEVTEIVVQATSVEHVFPASKIIERKLQIAHDNTADFQMIVPQELLRQAKKARQTLNLALGAIASISILVGGIGITNIMLANVTERTSEIGIRRAVGASRRDILFQFLSEAAILTSAGGIIGIGLGTFLVFGMSGVADWTPSISASAILFPLAMSFSSGFLFGLYPAWRAAKMEPAFALRQK
jgi:putative ABC transport system permease protein